MGGDFAKEYAEQLTEGVSSEQQKVLEAFPKDAKNGLDVAADICMH